MEMVKITVPEKIVAFSSGLVERAEGFLINCDEKNVEVVDILSRIKLAIGDIKKEQERHTKPLNDLKQGYIDEYKIVRKPFEDARDILNKKVIEYHRKQEEEAAKEQTRLRREETLRLKKLEDEKADLEKKGIKLDIPIQEEAPPPTVAAPEKTTSGIHSKMTIKKRPAFRLVNFEKIPDKYKVLNEPKVNEAARNGIKEISGMQFYLKESVANR